MKTYKQIIQAIALAKTYDEIMKIKFSHLDGNAYDCVQSLLDGTRKQIGKKWYVAEEKIIEPLAF